MQLSLSEPSFPALAKLAVQFGRWWLGEFLALLPERIVELLSSRPRPLLVITTGAQDIAFEIVRMAPVRHLPRINTIEDTIEDYHDGR